MNYQIPKDIQESIDEAKTRANKEVCGNLKGRNKMKASELFKKAIDTRTEAVDSILKEYIEEIGIDRIISHGTVFGFNTTSLLMYIASEGFVLEKHEREYLEHRYMEVVQKELAVAVSGLIRLLKE